VFISTRGLGGSASGLLTKGIGFIEQVVRLTATHARKVKTIIAEKTKEYYVTAMLMSINDEEINDPPIGHTSGEINNKSINTSAILIKINHMKLFLERIFISAGNIIGVRKHKKKLKDYRRKL